MVLMEICLRVAKLAIRESMEVDISKAREQKEKEDAADDAKMEEDNKEALSLSLRTYLFS
jgi:transitional endoplasmic reticulum ATPase